MKRTAGLKAHLIALALWLLILVGPTYAAVTVLYWAGVLR